MAGITGLILLFGLYSFMRTFQSGYLTGSLIGAALPAILMVVGIFDAQKFQTFRWRFSSRELLSATRRVSPNGVGMRLTRCNRRWSI